MIPSITSVVILSALVSYSIELPMPAGMDDNGTANGLSMADDDIDVDIDNVEEKRQDASEVFRGPRSGDGLIGYPQKWYTIEEFFEKHQEQEKEEKRKAERATTKTTTTTTTTLGPCARYTGRATDHCIAVGDGTYGCCRTEEDLFEYYGLCRHNPITCFGLNAMEKKKRR